jgi:hypothetical protein
MGVELMLLPPGPPSIRLAMKTCDSSPLPKAEGERAEAFCGLAPHPWNRSLARGTCTIADGVLQYRIAVALDQ